MSKHCCQYCGQDLNPYREGQKFCSPSCMSEYYKMHPELIPNEENLTRREIELERELHEKKKELREQEKIMKELKSKLK